MSAFGGKADMARTVKDAPFVKRTAIIDNYDYATTSFRVGNANASPKR